MENINLEESVNTTESENKVTDANETTNENTESNSIDIKERIKKAISDSKLKAINEEEYDAIAEIVLDYMNSKDKNNYLFYHKLPLTAQNFIDDFSYLNNSKSMTKDIRTKNILRERNCKLFFDTITTSVMMDEFMKTISKKNKTNSDTKDLHNSLAEIKSIIDESYKEAFDNIEKIRETNPEQADKILKIKTGFEKASDFRLQFEYIKNDSPKNVKRYHQHYNSDTELFTKYVRNNPLGVKIPSLDRFIELLRTSDITSIYSIDLMKACAVVIARSCCKLDITDIENIAYIHKLMCTIYQIGLTPNQYDYSVFNKISGIMDYIDMIIALHTHESLADRFESITNKFLNTGEIPVEEHDSLIKETKAFLKKENERFDSKKE